MESKDVERNDNNKVEVEIVDSKGNVVKNYHVSQEEAKMIPILAEARGLLDKGKPIMAMEMVLEALRKTQGDSAVWNVLDKAKAELNGLYEKNRAENDPHDDQGDDPESDDSSLANSVQMTLLEEQDRGHIIHRAIAQANTFICPMCNGVLDTKRREAHLTLWCPALD
eukprot:TRINITY_DN4084_c0_g1_i1.p1 TRINITY_DN4084_c0_g1~~TRINITY_DN4084_c0_g1_i1.p1  ORF type:complete len:179 (-),score=30.29 TRINITY_DN4084_c0_g1_i1:201-704(-)